MSRTRWPLYLDHAATTPLRPEVLQVMMACQEEDWGNPSSSHAWGRRARQRLDEARASVAESLGAPSARVFFTRGGTESDNLAVLGRTRSRRGQDPGSPVVVTSAVEHPAVFAAALRAVREGARHIITGFDAGEFDFDAFRRAVRKDPAVASYMWVNNETGLRLPLEEIAAECRHLGVPLHSDAVQAVGKIPLSLEATPVNLLTVTGHKMYGPKGTGALIQTDSVELLPLHFGGDQEGGLRPGTEDVAGAVGLAEAVRLAVAEQPEESARLQALRVEVESRLLEQIPDLRIYGRESSRAPHILSLGIPGVDPDTLLAALDASGIAASGGSACASGSTVRSRTLAALYPNDDAASLRLSFGRLTEERHIDSIVQGVATAISRTRELLPS